MTVQQQQQQQQQHSGVSGKALLSRIVAATSLWELEDVVVDHGGGFNHIHVAAACNRLPKVLAAHHADDVSQRQLARIVGALEGVMEPLLPGMPLRSVSQCMWGPSRVGQRLSPQLLAKIEQLVARSILPDVQASELDLFSLLAWGLAKQGVRDAALWSGIAAVATAQQHALRPQNVAALALSFAVAGYEDIGVLDCFAESVVQRLSGPQQGNHAVTEQNATVGGKGSHVSTVNTVPPTIETAVRAGSSCRVDECFQPRHIANLAWSYGKLMHPHPSLFTVMSQFVLHHLDEFDAKSLSMLLWGFKRVGYLSGSLSSMVLPHLIRSVGDMEPKSLACIAWCYDAKSGQGQESELFRRIGDNLCLSRLQLLDPEGLEMIARSFLGRDMEQRDRILSDIAECMRPLLSKTPPHFIKKFGQIYSNVAHQSQKIFERASQ